MTTQVAIENFENCHRAWLPSRRPHNQGRTKECCGCGERKALHSTWRRPLRLRWDKTHTLCLECHRALRNSVRHSRRTY